MIDTAQIDRAIVAHSQWKQRLRDAIASGKSELNVADAARANLCDFGRWLAELPAGEVAPDRLQGLREAHARFHKEAAHVLDLALHHRPPEAEAAMASGSPFVRVSTDLVMALTLWKHETLHPTS